MAPYAFYCISLKNISNMSFFDCPNHFNHKRTRIVVDLQPFYKEIWQPLFSHHRSDNEFQFGLWATSDTTLPLPFFEMDY